MTLDADTLFDRRRLKRQLSLWRVLAIALGLIAALVAIGRAPFGIERSHVARLEVSGLILEDRARDEALLAAAENPRVAALVVSINSPGGSVVGGEDLYRALRKFAEKKPVVAVMGTLATSAAYMGAVAADRIFAREGTITGSIGVIMQTAEFTGLLAKLGIVAESIKSSPLKAQPSPLEPLTPEARAATRAVIMDSYDLFVGMVSARRGLDAAAIQRLADGRVFTGRQAASEKLVDAIGDERAARDWLASERGVTRELPIRALSIAREESGFSRIFGGVFGKTFLSEGLILDGLVSVWHPDFIPSAPR